MRQDRSERGSMSASSCRRKSFRRKHFIDKEVALWEDLKER